MNDVAKIVGGVVGVVVVSVLLVLAGPLVGALAGWVVGWFFGDTILHVLGQVGLHDVAMWEVGMTIGFVGGFFKSSLTTSKEKK